jgi:protein SCO1
MEESRTSRSVRARVGTRWLVVLVVVLASAIGAAGALIARGSQRSAPWQPVDGYKLDRHIPSFPLRSSGGGPTSLAAYRGKVVVLTPFLTLCSEVCPLTTGAYLQMQHDARAAGLAGDVVFLEASVDGWRDSPARLRAFAKRTRATFPMVTGSPAQLRALWRFLGIGYRRVPQGHPPATDWWTGKPLTFDVEHTDGLFIIDRTGHERVIMLGMPALGGNLEPNLKSLLSDTGLQNLKHPQAGWTVPQALANLSHIVGRPIPPRPL